MKNILKKCIDELAKPEPKLDYIRGMLEVNKSKPKKKSSFQDRLESAMKEQQKKAAEKNLKNKK